MKSFAMAKRLLKKGKPSFSVASLVHMICKAYSKCILKITGVSMINKKTTRMQVTTKKLTKIITKAIWIIKLTMSQRRKEVQLTKMLRLLERVKRELLMKMSRRWSQKKKKLPLMRRLFIRF